MKRILMIATGGTIASRPGQDGMKPEISPEEILRLVPRVKGVCRVAVRRLLDLDSTNMRPENWLEIARCVEENYAAFDGFVITHGTDTMAYTAGALTYLIRGAKKSVVLTGAQQSICMEDTDARRNLSDAFLYAADADSHGVTVVFDGKVISGARARKERTKSFDAFGSIDYPLLGVIRDGRLLRYFTEPVLEDAPQFSRALDGKVFLLKLIPGLDSEIFRMLLEKYDALIIESFGVGGLPSYAGDDFLKGIELWRAAGKPVVMTTQVPYEGSDLGVYQVGMRVKKLGVIEARDMTPEAVVTKLMWILGQTRDMDQIERLFYAPVAHDILL